MALTIWLKPGEQIMLNGALVENLNAHKVKLRFNNQVRLLKQRDFFEPAETMTPGERVYHQAMLLSGGAPDGSDVDLRQAVAAYVTPGGMRSGDTAEVHEACRDILALVDRHDYYEAMIAARILVAAEDPSHPLLPRADSGS